MRRCQKLNGYKNTHGNYRQWNALIKKWYFNGNTLNKCLCHTWSDRLHRCMAYKLKKYKPNQKQNTYYTIN